MLRARELEPPPNALRTVHHDQDASVLGGADVRPHDGVNPGRVDEAQLAEIQDHPGGLELVDSLQGALQERDGPHIELTHGADPGDAIPALGADGEICLLGIRHSWPPDVASGGSDSAAESWSP